MKYFLRAYNAVIVAGCIYMTLPTLAATCPGSRSNMCADLTIDGDLTVTGLINGSDTIVNGGQPGPLVIGTNDATSLTFITDGTSRVTMNTTDILVDPSLVLLVNEIDPASGTTTCFSGNVSIDNHQLLVNTINPVNVYVCSVQDLSGTTTLGGNVAVTGNLTVLGGLSVYGTTVLPTSLSANNLCVANNVGVSGEVLANIISPLSAGTCFTENTAGTTQLSGNVACSQVLTTNAINAYNGVVIAPPANTTALIITSGNEIISSGNLTLSAGNINLPTANTSATQGCITLGGSSTATNAILCQTGTRNVFLGNGTPNTNIVGTDNIALGTNANNLLTAASNTVALGTSAQASAYGCISIGTSATTSDVLGIALGSADSTSSGAAPSASGSNAIALGSARGTQRGALASGASSLAVGSADTVASGATATGDHTIAIGVNAISNASVAISLGSGSGTAGGTGPYASNSASIAIGSGNSTKPGAFSGGLGAIAIGGSDGIFSGAIASGDRSIACGLQATSSGASTIAIGSASGTPGGAPPTATNTNALAIGSASGGMPGPLSSGVVSVAIGSADTSNLFSGPYAAGDRSIAIGTNAQALSFASVALGSCSGVAGGRGPLASGSNSLAIGSANGSFPGAISTGNASVAIGGASSTAAGAVATGDRSVAIGNGASVSQNDAIILGNAANSAVLVGIGTTTPSAKLHVSAPGGVPVMQLNSGSTAITSAPVWKNPATSAAAGTPIHYNASNQLFGFTSSRRYKENIRPITDESEVLYRLRPVLYDTKPGFGEGKDIPGFIAEEVYGIDPTLVVFNGNNQPETVAYNSFHALAIRELQRQQEEIAEHAELIDQLLSEKDEIIDKQKTIIATLLAIIDPYASSGYPYF